MRWASLSSRANSGASRKDLTEGSVSALNSVSGVDDDASEGDKHDASRAAIALLAHQHHRALGVTLEINDVSLLTV
jgi:hypothetical protein